MFNLDVTNVATTVPDKPGERRQLLTQIGESNDYLLVLDNSSAEKFTTCPRASFHYSVLGRESYGKASALNFGTAFHLGVEEQLRGRPLSAAIDKVTKFFQDHPTPLEEYRNCNNMVQILEHYYAKASQPDYALHVCEELGEEGSRQLIERPFEIPLGVIEVNETVQLPQWDSPRLIANVHVAWSGRIDLVANVNQKNRVVDHKTSSIAGDTFVQSFQLSNQTIGYVWAARQLWPELDITSFCLNVCQFKKPTGSGPIHLSGPRGGPPALDLYRAYFEYTPERLVEWSENALAIVSDFLSHLVRGYFPMHTAWCFGKYAKCQYHDVCSENNPTVRARMLQSEMYHDVVWDPTADR